MGCQGSLSNYSHQVNEYNTIKLKHFISISEVYAELSSQNLFLAFKCKPFTCLSNSLGNLHLTSNQLKTFVFGSLEKVYDSKILETDYQQYEREVLFLLKEKKFNNYVLGKKNRKNRGE